MPVISQLVPSESGKRRYAAGNPWPVCGNPQKTGSGCSSTPKRLCTPACTRRARRTISRASAKGKLTLLVNGTTAHGAHCAAADDRGGVWVCDPANGRLLLFTDTLPASGG